MSGILLFLCLLVSVGCRDTDTAELKPFRSDGCSLFPDQSLISDLDWCECCFAHDLWYWQGGTEEERLLADRELRDCILEKTGDAALAELMYQGVRSGGSPYFYNWYRWGYGWNYGRGYKPLTEAERALVVQRLKAYYANPGHDPCDQDGK